MYIPRFVFLHICVCFFNYVMRLMPSTLDKLKVENLKTVSLIRFIF